MQRKKNSPPPPPPLISVELFIIWGPLSSSETRFSLCLSHAIPCCVNTKQGENTKHARTAPDTGSFSPCSTFCVAKPSTGEKITTHLFVISSLARASSKSSDANGLCLSHTLSRAASLKRRPFVWLRYALQKRTQSMFSSSQGNHTLFSLLTVRLASPCSSNIYPGKMKQHGKVTGGRRAEGMTQLWTWKQTKMSKSSQNQKKLHDHWYQVSIQACFYLESLQQVRIFFRNIGRFAAPYLAWCPISFLE